MSYDNQNNDFLGYQGYIGRKNYTINIFILLLLYVAISLVNFESIKQFTTYEFLFSSLMFLVSFFKFIIIISGISLVYRRISDFSKNRSYKFFSVMKKIFIIFFVIPVLYTLILRYFFVGSLGIIGYIDLLVFLVIIPIQIILAIIFCFIK